MKNDIKKKFHWLEVWDIEEQEAWFTDMSLQGWKLSRIGKWVAVFEKCEPQKVNYRCVFKLTDQSEGNRLEIYKQSGWEHVASRGFIQIFREINSVDPIEIHTDPIEQGETLAILKRNINRSGLLTLLLSIIMLVLAIGTLLIDPVGNYLDDKFIESIVFVLCYISINFTMITGMIHMSKLKKKLTSGSFLEHGLDYRKKMNRNKIVGSSAILIVSIWVISVYADLIKSIEDRYPAIPSVNLPIVQISDIIDDYETFKVNDNNGEQGDFLNHYTVKSSILVPKQYELQQHVEVPGVMWADNSGTYSPTIWSYGYEVRSEWLAKKFLQDLKDKSTDYDENYRQEIGSGFDELWISKEDNNSAFIARKENNVYHVVYFGMDPIEELIEQTYLKVGQ